MQYDQNKDAVITGFSVEFSAGTKNPTFYQNTDAPLSLL